MNTSSPTTPFRRPTYRAPSPPTWACYEQIPYSDSGSDSDSGSESDSESGSGSGDESSSDDGVYAAARALGVSDKRGDELPDMDMDAVGDSAAAPAADVASQKDVKGKQRAVEPEQKEESPRKAARAQRKHRERTYNLRPILTIHKSQGFVWNQDLFVPPYVKDRYVASTSPPNGSGFLPGSWSSTNSSLNGYEVEVVEIRVKEGELDDIISP